MSRFCFYKPGELAETVDGVRNGGVGDGEKDAEK